MSQLHVIRLNNDVLIPVVGLGVYKMSASQETLGAIEHALRIGYRHIDTARIYNNEEIVGKAISSFFIPREQIFITTKVWNSDQGYNQTIKAFNKSLEKLNLKYIDLYLIHWPVQGKRKETWQALETLYEEGKVRAIGVSNYLLPHLEELMGYCKIPPAVNQLELHPYIYGSRIDTINFCRQNKIIPIAYSPLTKGQRLKDPALLKIASKYKKSTAQILLRWAVQHSFVVIPKSSVQSRIAENFQIFDFQISDQDMEALDGFNEGLATGWDPTDTL